MPVLLDTGPLVAFLNRRDAYHDWAVACFGQARPPLLTCESVLSEGCFLLRDVPGSQRRVLELIARRIVVPSFRLDDEHASVALLLDRYSDVPISLADACIVRMSEILERSVVFTLDSHFRIYRRHRRSRIPVWMPD